MNPSMAPLTGVVLVRGIQGGVPSDVSVLLPDGTEVVLGTPLADSGIRTVIRRVIILATVGALFYVAAFLRNLLRGNYSGGGSRGDDATSLWSSVSSLLIELSIPACGYCGAKYANRQLTCCFCGCNLCVTIVTIMSFIRLNIRIGEIDGQCERESNAQQRRTCELWTGESSEKDWIILSNLMTTCVGCLAFWFGNVLYARLATEVDGGNTPAPVTGEVVALGTLPGLGTSPGGGLPAEIAALFHSSPSDPLAAAADPTTPGAMSTGVGGDSSPDGGASSFGGSPATLIRMVRDGPPTRQPHHHRHVAPVQGMQRVLSWARWNIPLSRWFL